ncbi:MAG TPA: VWA domain-containing protein [Blastocatellia bacterium]|nr:VWA domain-containing protein [Blastocatellia bacterium]HMY74386.1 VWA domain-containing protein [Blastocatellia bacterium]HMZ18895.1 VWA domain-containing protein [Blastocatellia bacterium]HNG29623.1 VWA domain-containing protein [Blastocatellia bacterium]
MQEKLKLGLLLAVVGFSLALCLSARAQQEPEKKREEFGSSLKRLKWDPKKEAAVEDKDKKDKKDKKAKKPEAKAADGDDVMRIETVLAVFDLLVVDKKGRAITGLKPEDFVIKEDGKLQEVGTFAMGDDVTRPRSIVLIIDYSGSQRPYLHNSVAAAKILVDKLGPQDRMAIVTDDVELLVNFTKDKAKLKSNLDGLEQGLNWSRRMGRSEQYSALFATLRELVVGEERPIVIFQTDGDELMRLQPMAENRPQFGRFAPKEFGLTDIITAAQKTRTTIYSVVSGLRFLGLPPEEQMARARTEMQDRRAAMQSLMGGRINAPFRNQLEGDIPDWMLLRAAETSQQRQSALAGVAKLTGGWPEFLETPEQAAAIYSRILSDINRRYIIGYYPTNAARDGKLRKVHFEVRNHPEYVVWGRKSYYAPTQ